MVVFYKIKEHRQEKMDIDKKTFLPCFFLLLYLNLCSEKKEKPASGQLIFETFNHTTYFLNSIFHKFKAVIFNIIQIF